MSSPLVAPLAVVAVTWIVVRMALAAERYWVILALTLLLPLLLWETTLAWTGL